MNLHIYLALFKESFRFAMQNIRANLLRTLLSLLGVTIGVFCIIAILTLVDSLEYNIRSSISRFGDNLLFIQKYPWVAHSESSWREYMKRPDITYGEMQQLHKRLTHASAVAYNLFIGGEKVETREQAAEDILIRAVSYEYQDAMEMNFVAGRYFTEQEADEGQPVIILGHDLAESLFKNADKALDRDVRAFGRKLHVVGVMAKEGTSLTMGPNQDMSATVPANFVRSFGTFKGESFNSSILVKAGPNVTTDQMEAEVEGIFRSIRRLGPRDDDDFAVNRITILSSLITTLFDKVSMYGWVIAGFSILVGGFGIANIMFVSVKERTSIIGIQKALGAKRYLILIQFLSEAIMLCVFGGLIGLSLVFIISQLLNIVSPLKLIMTFKNVFIGIGISTLIGILAGFIPSWQAARMDPVEAIRFNM